MLTGIILFLLFCWIISYSFKKGFKRQTPSLRERSRYSGPCVIVTIGGSSFGSTQKVKGTYYGRGETINLGGYKITDPMLYVTHEDIKSSHDAGPHVICTSLSIGSPTPDLSANMGYWPSFSSITATDRGTYMKWLGTGKNNPDADIGLVFLYFYGLECRALEEKKDRKDVLWEAVRLFKIYAGSSNSFRRYAGDFIKFLFLATPDWSSTEVAKVEATLLGTDNYFRNDFSDIEQHLHGSAKPSWDGLFVIASQLDSIMRSVVPKKAGDLFKAHFIELCKATIGDISSIELQQKSVPFEYRSASALGLTGRAHFNAYLPSSQLKGGLTRAWNKSVEALRPFTSKATNKDISQGYAHLPELLKKTMEHPLQKVVAEFVTPACNVLKIGDVAEKIGMSYSEKFSAKESRSIAQTFEDCGYCIEPDARSTSKAYKWDDMVAAYKSEAGAATQPGAAYATAAMLFDLGVSVSAADGHIDPSELQTCQEFVETHFCKTAADRERIHKRSSLAINNHLSFTGLAKKVSEKLPMKETDTVAKYLVSVACSSERVDDSTIRALLKRFQELGISDMRSEELFKECGLPAVSGLATIRSGKGRSKKGSAIPAASSETEPTLDRAKLAQIMADTAAIADDLAKAFQDESAVQASAPMVTATAKTPEDAALDERHNKFYSAIIAKESWAEAEMRKEAMNLGLMLASAIDTVNEWAEQQFGEFLIEEGENYKVNLGLLKNKEAQSA